MCMKDNCVDNMCVLSTAPGQQAACMQTSGWNFGHSFQHNFQHFQRPVENIPSATAQLTYGNFQRHVLQQKMPLLIQV